MYLNLDDVQILRVNMSNSIIMPQFTNWIGDLVNQLVCDIGLRYAYQHTGVYAPG